MKRKLLVALMAVAMTASLAACGGGTDAPAAETPAEEAEETPAAEGEAETETPEEAPEADTAEGGLIQAAYLTKSRSEVWQLMSQGVVDQAADYGFEVTTMDCDMNAE